MDIFLRIYLWNQKRNLLKPPIDKNELGFIQSELVEFNTATTPEQKIDAMADLIIFATGYIIKSGYDPEKVLSETLSHIESRDGYIDPETGKFIKTTLDCEMYQPKYELCKSSFSI